MMHTPIPLQKRNCLCTTNPLVECRVNIPPSGAVGMSLEVPWPWAVSCGCVGITDSFGGGSQEVPVVMRVRNWSELWALWSVHHDQGPRWLLDWDGLGFVSKLICGRAAVAPSLQFQTSSTASDVLSEAKVEQKINYPPLEIFCSVALSAASAPGASSIC